RVRRGRDEGLGPRRFHAGVAVEGGDERALRVPERLPEPRVAPPGEMEVVRKRKEARLREFVRDGLPRPVRAPVVDDEHAEVPVRLIDGGPDAPPDVVPPVPVQDDDHGARVHGPRVPARRQKPCGYPPRAASSSARILSTKTRTSNLRAWARHRGARDSRSPLEREAMRFANRSAWGGRRNPVTPSTCVSRYPPPSAATTTFPEAFASTAVIPKSSSTEVESTPLHRAYRS